METFLSKELISQAIPIAALLLALFTVVSAFRSGALTRVRFGSFEVQASPQDKKDAEALVNSVIATRDDVPYETEQLANYYAQVLAQSKTSFWFSLIFAAIGFFVIVFAVFTHESTTISSTALQFSAGVVIDAVAGLFFVQSKNAQQSMGEFFDKLRKDRQQAESRNLCDSIDDKKAQDALKVQLALYYAGVEDYKELSKNIVERCLTEGRGYTGNET
ncbi:MAG: hypothetical protein ABNH16_02995 [Thalassolituus sp.]|jgi:uncharacterized protein YdiU (UPF0061 family)